MNKLQGRTVVVLGGHSFGGSRLAEALAGHGSDVRVLCSVGDDGSLGGLEHIDPIARGMLDVRTAAIADHDVIADLVDGADLVFYTYAPYRDVHDERRTSSIDSHIHAAVALTAAARAQRVGTVVFSASSDQGWPRLWSRPPGPDAGPSLVSIASAERALRWGADSGLPLVRIAPCTVYGPGQTRDALIPTILDQLVSWATPVSIPGPVPTREYVYIDDYVAALIRAATARPAAHQLRTGTPMSIGALFAACCRVTGVQTDLVYTPRTDASPMDDDFVAVVAGDQLPEWTPAVSLEEGLRRTVDWLAPDRPPGVSCSPDPRRFTTMSRRILVATGNRADYAPLSPLLHELADRPDVELRLLATGTHVAAPAGTRDHITRDGFDIDAEVEMLLASDTAVGVAKSLALCVIGVTETLVRLHPDIVVVLGDRYEALAVAQAAMVADIPIAHIGGGETTEGVSDEAIRHAVTKMAHLHFVAAPEFHRRVLQLGEHPSRVWTVGALGLDNLTRLALLDRTTLADQLGVDLQPPLIVSTYHPVARGDIAPAAAVAQLLAAFDAFPHATILMTKPNVDAGGSPVIAALEAYASDHPHRFHLFSSLGQQRYLSALAAADVVVGNSSSGLIEAPAVQTPTVNVGIRQHGRLRGPSVLDSPDQADAIAGAIQTALSDEFRAQLGDVRSPYGDGDAAPKIAKTLATAALDGLLTEPFRDLPVPTDA